MNITDVRIRLIENEKTGKLKAAASITIDNAIAIHDIKVIEGNSGLFIAMPSRKDLNGEFKDICHPINQTARLEIETAVLSKYYSLSE
jgi:stage V sporulation protein G